jgi:phosphoadenosine phosphosulfate reductase
MTVVTQAPEEAPDLEHLSAQEVLAYAVERYHPSMKVACSFQKSASVIMHMLLEIEPGSRFFTLDTGVLFPETYATWRALEERFGIEVETSQGLSLARQAELHGPALWDTDPDRCCELRKVKPLRETLAPLDAWVSDVRRGDTNGRASTEKLTWDRKHGLWKVNPLADWSEDDVWEYLTRHGIPYHPLHDRGYASIGCTHCTEPGTGREGRWASRDKVECGLH